MRKVKGFSYHVKDDEEVIKYIESQPNQSQYIWNLVREDMNKSKDSKKIEQLVKKYVEKTLKDKEIEIKQNKSNKINKKEIDQLLNIV